MQQLPAKLTILSKSFYLLISRLPFLLPWNCMSEFTLQAIIDGDSLQLSEVFASIAATELVDPAGLRQQLAADFFSGFTHTNPWDARLQPLLTDFKSAVLKQIASDDEFYCSAQHPLRAFFSTISPPASHWCLRDSKPNQQLFDKLSAVFSFTTAYWS